MIWVLVVLCVILAMLNTLVFLSGATLYKRIGEVSDEVVGGVAEHRAQHAKCMGAVAAFVGDQFAARVLDAAAEALSGMDGQADLARIANTLWVEDGPNVPVLWLRERADNLRGYSVDEDEQTDD